MSEGNMLQQNCDVLEVWLQEDDQLVFRPVGSVSLWGVGDLVLDEEVMFIGGYTSVAMLSENIFVLDTDTYIILKGVEGPKILV